MNFLKNIFQKKSETSNSKSKENLFSAENFEIASKIVSNYGNILEIYNDFCEPISILSNSKDEIKDALKKEFLLLGCYQTRGISYTENDSKYKEGLSAGFVSLANFMDDELSISYKKFSKTINKLTDPDSVNYKSIDLVNVSNDPNISKMFELQKTEIDSLSQEWGQWKIQVLDILRKINNE